MSRSTVYFDAQVRDGLTLSHEYVDGYLGLRGVEAGGRIDLHGSSTKGNASLKYAHLEDNLYGQGFDVGGILQMEWATVEGNAFLWEGSARELRGRGVTVDGILDLNGFEAERYDLRDAEVAALEVERTEGGIDLRGATVEELYTDDLASQDIRVDEETWIGGVYEDASRLDTGIDLTRTEQDFVDRIHERPRFPLNRRDGCTFTYDDLKRDFVMSHHHPVFMNLVQKGAVQRLDEEWYVVRSDIG